MHVSQFKSSLNRESPPHDYPPVLKALWYAHRNQWENAHDIVQNHQGVVAQWLHAYLHRLEGDLGNARYWYQLAGIDQNYPQEDELAVITKYAFAEP